MSALCGQAHQRTASGIVGAALSVQELLAASLLAESRAIGVGAEEVPARSRAHTRASRKATAGPSARTAGASCGTLVAHPQEMRSSRASSAARRGFSTWSIARPAAWQGAAHAPASACRCSPSARTTFRPISSRSVPAVAGVRAFSISSRQSRADAPSESPGPADAASPDPGAVADQLRTVMRHCAQPVAIITTYLHAPETSEAGLEGRQHGPPGSGPRAHTLVHGATLSSFTSVSLDPPLVAFSLRLPSRLAEALLLGRDNSGGRARSGAAADDGDEAGATATQGRKAREQDERKAHFVVSILAESQAQIARSYAMPGLEPYDGSSLDSSNTSAAAAVAAASFSSGASSPTQAPAAPASGAAAAAVGEGGEDENTSHPLETERIAASRHAHEGVPYLRDAIAAMACRLVRTVDLGALRRSADPAAAAAASEQREGEKEGAEGEGERSMLFLAEVVGVDKMPSPGPGSGSDVRQDGATADEDEDARPLLYWRRAFAKVQAT